MKSEIITLKFQGKMQKVQILRFCASDKRKFRKIFKMWSKLNVEMEIIGKNRNVNIPESLTEGLFCLHTGSVRVVKVFGGKSSFDTIDLKTRKRQQIKASSSKGPTSFGPTSFWDRNELYWMDFFKNGKADGEFDIYRIPDKFIYKTKVNKSQRLSEQQKQFRRPRINFKKVIVDANKLKPIKSCKI